MTMQELNKYLNSIKEDLSESEHQKWVLWMDYLMDYCSIQDGDGNYVIPKSYVDEWKIRKETANKMFNERNNIIGKNNVISNNSSI